MPKASEPPIALDPHDPQAVARDMRKQIEAAKRRMADYREEMEATGLVPPRPEDETPGPTGGGG